jgi:uncharacterized protein
MSTGAPSRRWLLFYDYVGDILERRAPHRDEHLALLRGLKDEGTLVMAGALGDPPHGAAFVFTTSEAAEAFARADPYVAEGLVPDFRVVPWNVVV